MKRVLSESAAWNEVARRFAERDFPSPVMKLRFTEIGVGDAAMELYDHHLVSLETVSAMVARIGFYDGRNLGPRSSPADRCLAALFLAEDARTMPITVLRRISL